MTRKKGAVQSRRAQQRVVLTGHVSERVSDPLLPSERGVRSLLPIHPITPTHRMHRGRASSASCSARWPWQYSAATR